MVSILVVVFSSFLVYISASFIYTSLLSSSARYTRSLPWVEHGNGWFGAIKSRLAVIFESRNMVLEGYEQFSRAGKLFMLPQFAAPPLLVLPNNLVHEFLSQGDDKIDHHALGAEALASKYTIKSEFMGESHFDVIRRQLTRKLPLLTGDVYAELVLAMQTEWKATKKEWTTVKIYPTCMKIVSRAANRVFSGEELCRNPDYLEHSRLYAQSVFMTGALMKLVPRFFHPIVGPLMTTGMRKHRKVCTDLSLPLIKRRLEQMQDLGDKYEAPTDVLQWVLDDAVAGRDELAKERTPEWISRFLLLLNMVAIHTTSIVISNTIMDIYTSPEKVDFVAGLREEVERVIGDDQWSKKGINDLLRIDSCIRETMRHQGLLDLGPRRLVKDPNGVTLGGGYHIPQGVRVAVPAFAIHHDEQLYDDADHYDAFRFSRPREEFMKQEHAPDRLEKLLDLKNQALVTTNNEFFSFGFGRHACPGRFFASQEMKLMLAHIVKTYDIEIDGSRPDNLVINGNALPKDEVEMRIRLR